LVIPVVPCPLPVALVVFTRGLICLHGGWVCGVVPHLGSIVILLWFSLVLLVRFSSSRFFFGLCLPSWFAGRRYNSAPYNSIGRVGRDAVWSWVGSFQARPLLPVDVDLLVPTPVCAGRWVVDITFPALVGGPAPLFCCLTPLPRSVSYR
jgi:hypothetical protein